MGCHGGDTRGGSAPLDVAEVLRKHAGDLPDLSFHRQRVVAAITNCRTKAMGGRLQECNRCGHTEVLPNSCRDRHCPKCQGLDQARWVQARQEDILPVEYFHVVFTIPEEIKPLFLAWPRDCYGLLFAAVSSTLNEVAANPKRLGARIGFTAVLHTWTQTLTYHPHIHCVVAGGGLAPDGSRWISCKRRYLLPVQVLSAVFRGKLLSGLESLIQDAPPSSYDIANRRCLERAARKSWVVYSKRPFSGPDQVIRYLSRYTHRIAISNSRLVSHIKGRVTFRYRDRTDPKRKKLLTLGGKEFARRFLIHVLPRGFVRLRHYGLLANAIRRDSIRRCREILGVKYSAPVEQPPAPTWDQLLLELTGIDPLLCPRCREGRLVLSDVPGMTVKWAQPGRATSP